MPSSPSMREIQGMRSSPRLPRDDWRRREEGRRPGRCSRSRPWREAPPRSQGPPPSGSASQGTAALPGAAPGGGEEGGGAPPPEPARGRRGPRGPALAPSSPHVVEHQLLEVRRMPPRVKVGCAPHGHARATWEGEEGRSSHGRGHGWGAGSRRSEGRERGNICLGGERRRSFASRWEAEAKCLPCLHCLLEADFRRKSTVRSAFLLLPCFVEVSLKSDSPVSANRLLDVL